MQPLHHLLHTSQTGMIMKRLLLIFLKRTLTYSLEVDLKISLKGKDKQDLTEMLKENGYEVILKMEDLKKSKASKIAGLLYDNHPPKYSKGRNDMLQVSSLKAIEVLEKNSARIFSYDRSFSNRLGWS